MLTVLLSLPFMIPTTIDPTELVSRSCQKGATTSGTPRDLNMPSLKDLTGKYHMSSSKSSDVSEVLKSQGFNQIIASTVFKAPVDIHVTQKSDNEVEIKQTTAASIPAITEQWIHDWEYREFKDFFLGKVKSRSKWTQPSQADDAFMRGGLKDDEDLVEAEVESLENGWVARQLWCFEGEDFVRRVVTSNKKGDEAQTRLVYELQS